MRRIVVGVTFALVAACVGRDEPAKSNLSEGCLLNSDCAAPLVCVFRRCHQPCNEPRDCPAGSDCQLAGDPAQLVCTQLTCEGAQRCPAGQGCNSMDRRCRAECRVDPDCAQGQRCASRQCVWAEQLMPDGGFPSLLGATSSCTYTSQCPEGQRCGPAGLCLPECLASRDCAPGRRCSALGACVDDGVDGGAFSDAGVDAGPSPFGCTYTSQCDAGAVCSSRGECVAECLTPRDCPRDFTCTAQRRCEPLPVADAGPTDAGCLYTTQCSPGLRCARTGSCEPECLTSRDCLARQECRAARCVPFLGDAGLADGGLPPGWGDSCFVSSTCTPPLVCGVTSQCVYECVASSDCAAQAPCCTGFRCVAGAFCTVPLGDGGVRDAGLALDGGSCRVDNDCMDDDYCNGAEACRAGRCVPGVNPCHDGNPCTNDVCNAQTRQCAYQTVAVDLDQDGHYPTQCNGLVDAGADDCDDTDPNTYRNALERCDWKDNNCNGAVDELRWRERPLARGSIAPSGYNPFGGPPAVSRVGDDVVVVAASHRARGSFDAYKLSATDFTLVSGPTPLVSSSTSWDTCSGTTHYGKQSIFPTLTAFGSTFALGGVTASYTSVQATCCGTGEQRTQRSFVSLFDTALNPTTSTLFAAAQTGTCHDLIGRQFVGVGNSPVVLTSRPAAAFSAALGKWVAAWWDTPNTSTAPRLRFTTVSDAGVVDPARFVWLLAPPAEVFNQPLMSQDSMLRLGTGVSVGARSVLVAWTNETYQPFTTMPLRWAILGGAPLDLVAGPFAIAVPSTSQPIVVRAWFDGSHHTVITTGAGTVRALRIDEDGAAQSFVTLAPDTESTALEDGFGAGVAPGVTPIAGNRFVAVTNTANDARLTVGELPADGGVFHLIPDILFGQSVGARSDFALVPLTDFSVGAVWTDGSLKKTVFECQ